MTSNEFRSIALNLPDALEKSHFNHPDFRVNGKIFATLGYPKKGWGMVKLTPKQQKDFVQSDPNAFMPVKGKWGVVGATSVLLRLAKKTSVAGSPLYGMAQYSAEGALHYNSKETMNS